VTQVVNADASPIGIVGSGRVAQALGHVLSEGCQPVLAVAGRDAERTAQAAHFIGPRTTPTTIEDIPAHASRVLIAVSDCAVEHVALRLSRCGFQRGIALHTCGAKGPEALAALSGQGVHCGALHPLQSFASAEQGVTSMPGSIFAIDGDSEAIEWCSSIVTLVGGRSLRIDAQDHSLYHAAAVMASNYVAALINGATEILEVARVEPPAALSMLAPLVRACTENSLKLGPVEALTGPIERGDSSTVASHLKALRRVPNPVKWLYCSVGQFAVEMALRRGLAEAKADELQEMLRSAQ
jgi:predicted short-subunit dehydrogenase-like oxidoreductase (DUF2520 family)